jgi:hypothetical protein
MRSPMRGWNDQTSDRVMQFLGKGHERQNDVPWAIERVADPAPSLALTTSVGTGAQSSRVSLLRLATARDRAGNGEWWEGAEQQRTVTAELDAVDKGVKRGLVADDRLGDGGLGLREEGDDGDARVAADDAEQKEGKRGQPMRDDFEAARLERPTG